MRFHKNEQVYILIGKYEGNSGYIKDYLIDEEMYLVTIPEKGDLVVRCSEFELKHDIFSVERYDKQKKELTLVRDEPTFKLTYKLQVDGFTHELTYKQIKELKVLLGSIINE